MPDHAAIDVHAHGIPRTVLDEIERNTALAKAKQQYLRDIDRVMQ